MNAYNKLEKDCAALKKELAAARGRLTLFEPLDMYLKNTLSGRLTFPIVKHASKKTERIVQTIWSDLHFGSDINPEETGSLKYGAVEEARRMAAVVDQISTYKKQYRAETELEILLIGDVIQNCLHDARDGAPLAEQFARTVHILNQAIGYLSTHFKKIRVRTNPGNHGRNTARHSERAIHQKWDAIETMVYTALKHSLANVPNVEFFIPKTPFVTYSALGNKVFATHGDTVLKPGNPNSSINTKELQRQINSINASLPDVAEYRVFAMGHVHIASITYLPNGSAVITNGPLVPTDQFGVSLGALETRCGQWIWESTADHAVGDSRLITVDVDNDRNKSLDKIIKPWRSL